jgi:SAM-dependent methyltransferase
LGALATIQTKILYIATYIANTRMRGLSHQPMLVRHYLAQCFPFLPKLAIRWGYNPEQWIRVVQRRQWRAFFDSLPLEKLAVLEISPGPQPLLDGHKIRRYRAVNFPEFDITRDCLSECFDLIIAEQVFEHLRHPYRAGRNVWKMLNDDGVFMIATPFLVRIHGHPFDYTRWTKDGLSGFLEDCGFSADVYSWGNRQAIRRNFARWREYGWKKNLDNEPDFPVNVWAFARKMNDASGSSKF